jgi:hypothetical protein
MIMGKLLCASLEQDLNVKNRLRILGVGCVLLAASLATGVSFSFADDPAQSGLSSSSPKTEEAQIPLFDVEIAQLSPDRTAFRVGDVIAFKVVHLQLPAIQNASKELVVELPESTEADENGKEGQSWSLIEGRTSDESNVATELPFVAVPLKPGKVLLPSLLLKDRAGKVVAKTRPLAFEIESAIKKDDPKPQELEESLPPVSLEFPWWVIMLMGIFGLTLFSGIAYGIYKFVQRRKPAAPAIAKVQLPEDQVAMTQFLELERQSFLMRGDFKTHYFRVSEILKTYVGARFQFDALESTTQEIIRHFEDQKVVSDTLIDRFESLFEKLDRVKFTDHQPRPEESQGLIEEAREFVRQTRRPPLISSPQKSGQESHALR